VTSVITLLEILVRPKSEGNLLAVWDHQELLTTYHNLASDVRAKFGFCTPDASPVASALHAGTACFLTNEAQLKQVKELEVLLLDEFGDT